MTTPYDRATTLYALFAAVTLSVVTGCATTVRGSGTRARPPSGPVDPSNVTDEGFAQAVHLLMRDGRPTVERQALLAGTVRRQLSHAADRLRAKQRDRGVSTVLGGLYLVRAGELRPEMIDQTGDLAISLALDVVGGTGDEGRSLALYEVRRLALPPEAPGRRDTDEHLAALDRWIIDTTTKEDVGPTERSGALERRLASRALLFPTDEALRDVTAASSRWIDAGVALQGKFRASGVRPKREEAIESFRAVASGAASIAALYLRHGDAAGAVEALTKEPFEKVTPPGLIQRLQAAVRPGDAAAWRDLLELFGRPDQRDEETAVDRALLQAATFHIAMEAYRRDPTAVDSAMQLAAALTAFGMAEAAPAVLSEAAERHPDPRVLSSMLESVARSMAREEGEDDPGSARRTFAASAQLLAVADRSTTKARMNPTPARFRLLGATIDAHAGELAAARAVLVASLAEEASAEGKRLLADVERGLGNGPAALEALRDVSASPDAKRERVLEAEARMVASDIHREMGGRDKAREELLLALSAAVDARRVASGAGPAARAERVLARVLDRLGDDAGVARATERAFAAAKGDPRQLATTALDAMSRAYVARDVAAARRIGKLALGANLRDDELVYLGLWLTLLERELGGRADETAVQLLAGIEQNATWPGRLAAWASGKLTDDELGARARTPSQRTEAAFYRGLARRVAGDAPGADNALRGVVAAKTLDLFESQMARDLLAGAERRLPGPPPSVAVP